MFVCENTFDVKYDSDSEADSPGAYPLNVGDMELKVENVVILVENIKKKLFRKILYYHIEIDPDEISMLISQPVPVWSSCASGPLKLRS